MDADEPLLIRGLTSTWLAHSRWAKEVILKHHGSEPYQLFPSGHRTLAEVLAIEGQYHLGHGIYPPTSCYAVPWRQYSPMPFGSLRADFSLPAFLGPLFALNMGVGTGYGIGVPPENHPGSWWAIIKGRKRCAPHPEERRPSLPSGTFTKSVHQAVWASGP